MQMALKNVFHPTKINEGAYHHQLQWKSEVLINEETLPFPIGKQCVQKRKS
jgi:hypothetical protein